MDAALHRRRPEEGALEQDHKSRDLCREGIARIVSVLAHDEEQELLERPLMSGKQPKKKDRPGVDRLGRTPLHYAALEGKLTEVERLLSAGPEPSPGDDNGWTPLHFAAQSWSVSVAEALLAAGAEVDATDAHGNTPLSTAVFASRGRGELIALLRARGADPQRQNLHGVSPLSLARAIANYDVRQYFSDLPST